jgi:thymidylate synthase
MNQFNQFDTLAIFRRAREANIEQVWHRLDHLNQTDRIYHELVAEVLDEGQQKGDRTGTGTKAVVGRMAHFNLMNGRQPRLTTKPIIGQNPEEEMFWFISGDTNIKMLRDKNIGIWNSWLIPGTAKYEPMTEAQVKKAIILEHRKEYGADATTQFFHSPEYPVGVYASEAEAGKIYQRELYYADLAALHSYYKEFTGKDPLYLAAGDIGKGGYGAQWRHWEDTQLVLLSNEAELKAYYAQGYIMLGEMDHCLDGQVYAVMHRKIDQLANAINLLKDTPDSRRIIVSAWNPALTWKAALPPCHLYFQFISHELTVAQRIAIINDRIELVKRDTEVEEARTHTANAVLRTWASVNRERDFHGMDDEAVHAALDLNGVKRRNVNCFLLLRSNDLGLGMPFNVSQYAALTHMVAQVVGMEPGELVWAAVDAHVYNDHVKGLMEQLGRESIHCIPRIKLDPTVTCIDDFDGSKIEIVDYESQPALINKMLPSV